MIPSVQTPCSLERHPCQEPDCLLAGIWGSKTFLGRILSNFLRLLQWFSLYLQLLWGSHLLVTLSPPPLSLSPKPLPGVTKNLAPNVLSSSALPLLPASWLSVYMDGGASTQVQSPLILSTRDCHLLFSNLTSGTTGWDPVIILNCGMPTAPLPTSLLSLRLSHPYSSAKRPAASRKPRSGEPSSPPSPAGVTSPP